MSLLPFMAGGAALSLVVRGLRGDSNRLYFADLIGAGLRRIARAPGDRLLRGGDGRSGHGRSAGHCGGPAGLERPTNPTSRTKALPAIGGRSRAAAGRRVGLTAWNLQDAEARHPRCARPRPSTNSRHQYPNCEHRIRPLERLLAHHLGPSTPSQPTWPACSSTATRGRTSCTGTASREHPADAAELVPGVSVPASPSIPRSCHRPRRRDRRRAGHRLRQPER